MLPQSAFAQPRLTARPRRMRARPQPGPLPVARRLASSIPTGLVQSPALASARRRLLPSQGPQPDRGNDGHLAPDRTAPLLSQSWLRELETRQVLVPQQDVPGAVQATGVVRQDALFAEVGENVDHERCLSGRIRAPLAFDHLQGASSPVGGVRTARRERRWRAVASGGMIGGEAGRASARVDAMSALQREPVVAGCCHCTVMRRDCQSAWDAAGGACHLERVSGYGQEIADCPAKDACATPTTVRSQGPRSFAGAQDDTSGGWMWLRLSS